MLIDFAITNFRSIKERQVFSMLTAAKVKELPDNVTHIDKNIHILKSAIIYGRNASGKSNILKALDTFKTLVEMSIGFTTDKKNHLFNPYKLDKNCINKPIEFEINFIANDNIRYNYYIAFDETSIISERLYFYPNNSRAKLFIREKGKTIDFSDKIKGNKKGIEKSLYPNQLFLSRVGIEMIEPLIPVYSFFESKMIFSLDEYDDERVLENLKYFRKSNAIPYFFENLNKLIRIADTGINSLNFQDITFDSLGFQASDEIKREFIDTYEFYINLKHPFYQDGKENGETEFRLNEESTGTIKLLIIGIQIIETLYYGKTLIIDELDKSLHPKLTRTLISIFNNPKTNPNNAQLIFATHDVSLLSNEMFRRDQIWFTEKEANGATTLYSLADLKDVRNTVSYEKYYMQGAFGAVPVINEYDLDFNFGDEKTK